MLYHRKDGKFVDRYEANVRRKMVFIQDSVDIASWNVGGGHERSTFKTCQRKSFLVCHRMVCGEYCIDLVLHKWKKLIALTGLIANETNIYPAFLDPVCQFPFVAFDDLKADTRMIGVKFFYDAGNPMDGTT